MKDYEIKFGILHGLAIGYIFYVPSLDNDNEEDNYELHQFCFLFFNITILIWNDEYPI